MQQLTSGDVVVHPQGVATVRGIISMTVKDVTYSCYELHLVNAEVKIYVPLGSSLELKPVATGQDVCTLWELLSQKQEISLNYTSWKANWFKNKTALQQCTFEERAKVYVHLLRRKTLAAQEQDMLGRLEKFLVAEVAAITGRTIQEIKKEFKTRGGLRYEYGYTETSVDEE